MSLSNQTHPTLIETMWRSDNKVLRNIMLAVAGSLALWISAKIQVPFFPVPITMQTFMVLTIGMVFGWRLGSAAILLYLAEGAIGLPVFAGTPEKGLGLAYMMGPTGGYLLGYLLAVFAMGWLAEKAWDRNVFTTAIAMLIGNVLIYVSGLLWLGAVLGWDKPILQWGLMPFIPGDVTKLALAAMLLPYAWKLVNRNLSSGRRK